MNLVEQVERLDQIGALLRGGEAGDAALSLTGQLGPHSHGVNVEEQAVEPLAIPHCPKRILGV